MKKVMTDSTGDRDLFVYVGTHTGGESRGIYLCRFEFVQHAPTQGREPRHFTIDPTGNWLLVANQNTSNIVVMRIDSRTGRLEPAGLQVETPNPICLQWFRNG